MRSAAVVAAAASVAALRVPTRLFSVPPSPLEKAMAWGGELAPVVRETAMMMQCCVRLCMEVEEALGVAEADASVPGTQVRDTEAFGGKAVVKGDQTPVTAADFAIQGFLSAALAEKYPQDRFMGEEDASALREDPALFDAAFEMAETMATEYDMSLTKEDFLKAVDRGLEARDSDRVWILDPIDGTKGLVTGQYYVIGLALVDSTSGEPLLGLMGNPRSPVHSIMVAAKHHGIRYWPYAGFGYMQDEMPRAWADNNFDYSKLASDAPGSWGETGSLGDLTSGVDYPPYLLSRPVQAGSPMPFGPRAKPDDLCCGALVKYWATASGEVAGFIMYENKLKAWDHAAGVICVNESGGSALDAASQPVRFTGRDVDVDAAIICTSHLADPKARHLLQAAVPPSSTSE